MRHVLHLLLPLVMAVLAGIAHYKSTFSSLDLLVYDSVLLSRDYEQDKNTIVIAIDEQSINAIGPWPWPRDKHAELINKLRESGAKSIYLDILLVGPDATSPQNDEKLKQALLEHGNVVIPMYIDELATKAQLIEVLPYHPFIEAAAVIAHPHIPCGGDGICRSVYLKEGLGSPVWPHLSLALMQRENSFQLQNSGIPGERGETDIEGSYMLVYRDYLNYIPFGKAAQAGNKHIRTISYIDVLEGSYANSDFENKTIFIGATAAGVNDIFSTPTGRIPGVEIGAIIYESFKHNKFIKQVPQNTSTVITVIAAFALLSILSYLSPTYFFISTLALLAGTALFTRYSILTLNLWLPLASFWLAIVLFYPLWSWARLALALHSLKLNLKLLSEPTDTLSPIAKELFSETSTFKPLISGAEVVSNTVDKLFTANQLLETQRQLLKHSVDNLEEAFILFKESGEIILCNKQADKIFSTVSNSALIFEKLELFSNPNDLSAQQLVERILRPKEITREELSTRPIEGGQTENIITYYLQGQCIEITRDSISRPDTKHVLTAGLITLTDITEIKRAERSRLDTLHFISHDLRSPMVSIISLIKHSRNKHQQTEQSEKLLNQIEQYTLRNLDFAESLLQLNRAEGANSANFSFCDLHSILDNVYAQFSPVAKDKSIKLHLKKANTDMWVNGDNDLLERAIGNLVSNAIKFSLEDSDIYLDLSANSSEAPQATVTVKDNGPGISEQDLPHIFKRFRRLSGAEAKPGAGVGLFFVQTVVEKHAGSISVNSKLGAGSRFEINLPLSPVDDL